ncbi:MAG TPA: DUF4382 domain-containing protein [Noviherbaspirillum sp.]|uniref:DUF4382 domain-containing protein n=1 Tax=Noviherbaspirillum sp. TaxID=1926288 RepID=UPI002B460724|nr:DUF4382 domain-containing protein [Noviherbaspirillum sp.]HJV87086.1 DUF4382 domain-containing protein [Noviherbaspirillum sp.]
MYAQKFVRTLALPSAIGLATLLSACGGGGSGVGTGTLQVSLTDAPSCGFDQMNVTVSKVRVHQSASASDTDSGWHDISLSPARKINLLTLTNGILQDLGKTTLPAGHYTQVRLVLDTSGSTPNSVVPEGSSTEIPLVTPSGMQTGIKLINEFDVAANQQVDLVLDFDACKSIVSRGNGSFSLKPVISVIPTLVSGGISGYLPTGLTRPVVTAQQNGVVVKSTVPDATGAFNLSPLPASSTGYVVVITADGRTTAAITGVPVTTGTTTPVSTSSTPVSLAGSTMRTISGIANPVAAQATVRATQTYASGGPKVEVAFKQADLTTGAYSLSVPTAAPLLGKFGTLPIALTADSTIAGKYTLEASATGYTTQIFNADVGTADVTKDFTLAP